MTIAVAAKRISKYLSRYSSKAKPTRFLRPQFEQFEPRLPLATAVALVGDNGLIGFDTATPGTTSEPPFPYGGLVAGDSLVSIDMRPSDRQLYALSSGSRIYRLQTGFATQIGADGSFALNGSAFGFDFNPAVDRIRVTSDADQNLRLNPNDGTLTAVDTPLAYDVDTDGDGPDTGDVNAGQDPSVAQVAYSSNVAGTASTVLYGIDDALNTLVVFDSPNSGVLRTIGPLGVDVVSIGGFDILTELDGTTTAFAALSTDGVSSALYSIDLLTGAAVLIGNIGASPTLVRGLAITPPIPAISIQKLTNSIDNNVAPGLAVPVGSSLTFTYKVESNAAPPLSDVTVRDDNGTPNDPADDFNATLFGGDKNGNGLLEQTETWTFLATSIATSGQHMNIAVASGLPPTGPRQQKMSFDIHFGANPTSDLVISKTTVDSVAPGGQVRYRVDVRNNGPFDLGAVERQIVAVTGVTGSFTLTFDGQTTAPLSASATGSQVRDALNALTTIGGVGGDVFVLQDGSVYTITFRRAIGDQNLSQLVGAAAGGASIVVATLQDGKAGVRVQDIAPPQLTNVSFSTGIPGNAQNPPGGYAGGSGNLDQLISVPARQSVIYEVRGTLDAGASGSLSNTATATIVAAVTEVNPANNSSTVTDTITPQADVRISKTDSPDPVIAGSSLSYTITVSNIGPSGAQNVTLSDAIPSNTTFVSANQNSGPAFTLTLPAVGNAGTFSGAIESLADGASATFTLVVRVNASVPNGSTVSNTATVSTVTADTNLANNSITATTTVSASSDLAVTKTGSPGTVTAGTNLTYTITLTNTGPSDAQTVTLTDAIPGNTTFVSGFQVSGPAFTGHSPPVGGTGIFSETAATLTSGASAVFRLVVRVNAAVTAGSTIGNTATVTTATTDSNAANNSAVETTAVNTVADLLVTKIAGASSANPGENMTYTITVSNIGASDAQTVSLTDVIPVNTAFVSAVQTSGPMFVLTMPPAGGPGTFTATTATFSAGATATFTLIAQAHAAEDLGTEISNTVTVSTVTEDSSSVNNSDTVTTTISGLGLLECEVTTLNSPGAPGTASIEDDADNPGENVLVLTGTSKNDVIVVEPQPRSKGVFRVVQNKRVIVTFLSSEVPRMVVFGMAGNDVITINGSMSQAAKLFGNEGNDVIASSRGNDGIDGGPGNDIIFGGAGNDELCGGDGNDQVYGGLGNDVVGGDTGNDKLYGEAGNDLLLGGDGSDYMYGGSGDDRLFGQIGNDQMFGDAGNDVVVGGNGNDKLYGSSGRDVLIGGLGADSLFGGAGDDVLIAGSTSHDEDDEALQAILAEWAANRSYAMRINNLRSGGGNNGTFTLDEATVLDDGDKDTLQGESNQDWFLIGTNYKIRDRAKNELVN